MSRLLLARALLIISLAPILARALHLLDTLGITTLTLRLAVWGAVVYSIGYVLVIFCAPELAKNHSNSQAYAEKMANMVDAIDATTLFGGLPRLLERCGKICLRLNVERLDALLPVANAYERLGKARAAYLLGGALYELSDVERPAVRVVLAVLMAVGTVMMLWSIACSLTGLTL